MLEALEAMAKDNQQIPPRAMVLSRKYRTLVSSWIEPLQEEAELGYEIDFIARYCFYLSNSCYFVFAILLFIIIVVALV